LAGDVGLSEKKRTELVQIERPAPTEIDDEIELIDLSTLTTTTGDDKETAKVNETITIEPPVKWWINDSGDSVKEYKDGRLEGKFKATSKYRQLCVEFPRDTSRIWRSGIGERIRPTQIVSLLSQNLSGEGRPASTFYWWKQTDEGYYLAQAKKGLAEFIAETTPNYYCVPQGSKHRLKFKCPDLSKSKTLYSDQLRFGPSAGYGGTDDHDATAYDGDNETSGPADIGDILIYINPANDQAIWYCPKCTRLNAEKYGGDGKSVTHPVPRELRDLLAKDGIIPPKEYKYKDRLAETDKLLDLIIKNPGMSFYQLDQAMGWDSDGRNSERIINKHLMDKVRLAKGRGKNKGYKVYIKH
jgi:hypothetical protein